MNGNHGRHEFSRLLDGWSMAALRDNRQLGARNSLSIRMALRQGNNLIATSPDH